VFVSARITPPPPTEHGQEAPVLALAQPAAQRTQAHAYRCVGCSIASPPCCWQCWAGHFRRALFRRGSLVLQRSGAVGRRGGGERRGGGSGGGGGAGCRSEAPVRSRFAGEIEDAATCANQAGARGPGAGALCSCSCSCSSELRAGHTPRVAERSRAPSALPRLANLAGAESGPGPAVAIGTWYMAHGTEFCVYSVYVYTSCIMHHASQMMPYDAR
jgi:hypothetical protein